MSPRKTKVVSKKTYEAPQEVKRKKHFFTGIIIGAMVVAVIVIVIYLVTLKK